MVKRLLIIPVLIAFALSNLQAQSSKVSKREEIALLKQAHKEATDQVKELSAELAARVKEVEELLVKNGELEKIKSENKALKAQLSELKRADIKENTGQKIVPIALFFEIGKVSIGAKERVNLEFYVESAIEANPDRVFTILAIEDTSSGTKNKELSFVRYFL